MHPKSLAEKCPKILYLSNLDIKNRYMKRILKLLIYDTPQDYKSKMQPKRVIGEKCFLEGYVTIAWLNWKTFIQCSKLKRGNFAAHHSQQIKCSVTEILN